MTSLVNAERSAENAVTEEDHFQCKDNKQEDFPLAFCHKILYTNYRFLCGELAQLGERLNGIQEVRGSIPLFSIFV